VIDPRSAAIQVEVVKVGMSQSKDGYFLRLALHPSDSIASLVSSPVGTRYVCAFVEVDDRQEPVAARDTGVGSHIAVSQAALLCRELAFQRWLVDNQMAPEQSERAARDTVCRACGIASRSELATNEQARELWKKLRTDFMNSLNL
jgi:hypothetical protein